MGFDVSADKRVGAEYHRDGSDASASGAITMMESKRPEIKKQGDYLLTYLLSKRPMEQQSTIRIGFAGPPGAGKSSLIEAFGMYLLEKDQNLRIAAVCIDPSSGISGGSILGDKTRMTELSRSDRAYVRPSSNAGVLGGLAACTCKSDLIDC
jgi:LAO/AO transport system kinase